jgi:hypothetical protein
MNTTGDVIQGVYDVITVWEPWATLIAEELKPWEFRGWAPPVDLIGRRLVIHAGKRRVHLEELKGLLYKLERGGDEAKSTGLINRERCITLIERWIVAPLALPLSSLICVATVGQPIRNQDLASALGIPAIINDSDRSEHSNWGWPLSNIEKFKPFVPATGQRGLWKWTAPRSPLSL